MSNALGIASVTHVIKDLLNDGLINQNVAAALGTTVTVSSLPPGQVEVSSGTTPTQLNLFMYRVSPNSGWNNVGYPSRNQRGDVINNPPLALNLHYLLTAFGESELHAEILLGYGMQLLHEHPFLDRDAIRSSLTPATVDNPQGRLPNHLVSLATSELAEQIEQIKIVPETINIEEISRLWSAFQSRYRTCTAYLVKVVLIESQQPAAPPLPVKERRIFALPFRRPIIEKILSQSTSNGPILENQYILVGHRLVIRGKQLKGETVYVRINGQSFASDDSSVSMSISDTQISLMLPDSLRAGIQGVQVVQNVSLGNPPVERSGVESNLFPFVLSPSISTSANNVTNNGNHLYSADIEVTTNLLVYHDQRIVLLWNELSPIAGEPPASYSFLLPGSFWEDKVSPEGEIQPVDKVTFSVSGLKAASYLVRLQVDGAESPLSTDSTGAYNSPQITIP